MSRPRSSRRAALTARKYNGLGRPAPVSEDLVAPSEDLVQRLAPKRRALRQLGADLLDVLLPALRDLVLEELRQRAVAQPLLALLGMVHHEIRDERARQPPRLQLGILNQERVHGAQWPRHALPGRSARG